MEKGILIFYTTLCFVYAKQNAYYFLREKRVVELTSYLGFLSHIEPTSDVKIHRKVCVIGNENILNH